MDDHVEAAPMSPAPAVRCTSCSFSWNSSAMAQGLRLIGSCPKCDGELAFRESALHEDTFEPVPSAGGRTAPHLVLGIPRR
jgi:hypothetical protein